MNKKLRLVWIIPNVFCYLMVIGLSIFVLSQAKELEEINRLSLFVFTLFALLFISLFGSYRIRMWIKAGKL